MTELLIRLFIRDKDNVQDPTVRQQYGTLSGLTGICLNILLFLGKLVAGTVSGSIAITADAFNNLSDAGSSVVTLIGFRLAGQKPDRHHPFGHGRVEYLSGLAVSVVILLMGFELGKTSFEKISPLPQWNFLCCLSSSCRSPSWSRAGCTFLTASWAKSWIPPP